MRTSRNKKALIVPEDQDNMYPDVYSSDTKGFEQTCLNFNLIPTDKYTIHALR